MSLKYVWSAMHIFGSPPTGEEFFACQGDYKYYPFPNRGSIYTADSSLWKQNPDSGGIDHAPSVTYWPTEDEVSKFILDDANSIATCMIIFVERSVALTIDPANSVPLQLVPPALTAKFLSEFTSYGYDVIDISGLSALVNIGYDAQDLSKLAESSVRVNEYGLIAELNSSFLFAEFASDAAPEHVPLFPAEVWIREKR